MLSEAFPARLEALHPLQEKIQDYLRAQDCSESTLRAVELVCEELLVNSVTHGQARAIELRLEKRGDEIAIRWAMTARRSPLTTRQQEHHRSADMAYP